MRGPKTELTLQSVSKSADAVGGYTESWSDDGTIKGVLTNTSGYEQIVGAGKERVYSTHKFFCDYPPSLTVAVGKRFKLGSRYFDIKFVLNPANTNRLLVVYLEELTE